MNDKNEYFSGQVLYGDNFSNQQIEDWFKQEQDAYYNMYGSNDETHYEYNSLNTLLGYKYLKNIYCDNVMGFGSAYGDEFLPVLSQIKNITIIEAAENFWHDNIQGKPVKYVKPNVDGHLDFYDNSFDLITCFGVLHHIPNVSYVISEFYRCLKNGGYLLIREPIVSMGDWRKPRRGLTKMERGIPIAVFRDILKDFEIVSEQKCCHPITAKITSHFVGNKSVYNSNRAVYLDIIFSKLLVFSTKYHSTGFFDRIRPQSVFYVLKKK